MEITAIKMKYLREVINIKKNDTIVVTGAGGKTSLCLELCEELKESSRIIFTTTTKIFPPEMKKNYNIFIGEKFLYKNLIKNGVYITGSRKNKDGKILPYTIEEIDLLKEKSDYLIIEGDGSKAKPLKGWNETEPVYVKRTDKTIGVLNIKSIGLKMNDDNIHRLELFLKISGAQSGDIVNEYHLEKIVNSESGLFKDSKGEKILFINQTDSKKEMEKVFLFAKILYKTSLVPDKIIAASLKKKEYYLISLQ